MKKIFFYLVFLMLCVNAFAVACLTFEPSGCYQFSPTSYTDSTDVTAMYKCGGGGDRVDIIGMWGTEISDGELVYDTTNLGNNIRCFCRITYPFLSAWVSAGDECSNPYVGTIGCVSNCAELLTSGTKWEAYK